MTFDTGLSKPEAMRAGKSVLDLVVQDVSISPGSEASQSPRTTAEKLESLSHACKKKDQCQKGLNNPKRDVHVLSP